jgi:hypothetical protein
MLPFSEADTAAVWVDVTELAVAANGAEVDPPGTETVPGTLMAALFEERITVVALAGAPESETEQELDWPAFKIVGLHWTALTVGTETGSTALMAA